MLTKEQIERLQQISKLDREEQKKQLESFLATLSKEQVDYLMNSQQSCIFCGISHKKVKSEIVYEDEEIISVLDIKPISPGHCIVIPKKHDNVFEEGIHEKVKRIASAIQIVVDSDNVSIKVVEDSKKEGMHVVLHLVPENSKTNLKREDIADGIRRVLGAEETVKPKPIVKEENKNIPEKPLAKEEIDNEDAIRWLERRVP